MTGHQQTLDQIAILSRIVQEALQVRDALIATLPAQQDTINEREIWLSSIEAALETGLSGRHIRRIAKEQGLGVKNGGRWEIRRSDLARVRQLAGQTDKSDMETDISDVP